MAIGNKMNVTSIRTRRMCLASILCDKAKEQPTSGDKDDVESDEIGQCGRQIAYEGEGAETEESGFDGAGGAEQSEDGGDHHR